jgi:uncharacterized cupin superfamily protein
MTHKVEPGSMAWTPGRASGFFRKDLLKLTNGDVKLVKIEPMSFFPPHAHTDKTEFVWVLEGSLEITVAEDGFPAGRGAFVSFPTGVTHSLRNSSSSECVLLIGTIASL